MIQFWSLHILQKQLVKNLPPFKRSPSFLPRHQHSAVVANFSYCMIHVEWWNRHLFALYMFHLEWPPFSIVYDPLGMMAWPPFPHCIYDPREVIIFSYCCCTWNDPPFPIVYVPLVMTHLFPLYMFHLEWPPFSIVSTWNDGMTTFFHCIYEWLNDWMTTFSHCIWSTWNDHLFPLYMIHVEWWNDHLFPIVYDPPGMTTFSHCIWSTWNDHLFPIVYMNHVEWWNDHLFPLYIIWSTWNDYMTTFFHCIWSTWNDGITTFSPLYRWSTWSDYLFLLYMIHVEWPPFPILYDPPGTCARSSCWLLTTLWFSCLLQEPTVTLSVLVLSPSLSSLSSSGRSSVSYSSDEVKSLKDLQSLREMALSIGCYK